MSNPNLLPMDDWGKLIIDEPHRAVVALCDPLTGESLTGPTHDRAPSTPPEYFTADVALKPGYDYWRNSYATDPDMQLGVYFANPTDPNGFDVDDFRENVIGRSPEERKFDVVLFDFTQGVYETELANHERARQGLPYDPIIAEEGAHEVFLDKFFDVIVDAGAEARPIDAPMVETESGLFVPAEKSARIVKALRETVYPLALSQDFGGDGPEAGFLVADMVSENYHQHYDVGRSGAILHEIVATRSNQGLLPDVLVVMPNGQRDIARKFRRAGAMSVRGYDGIERDERTVDDNEMYKSAMETGLVEFTFEAEA